MIGYDNKSLSISINIYENLQEKKWKKNTQ